MSSFKKVVSSGLTYCPKVLKTVAPRVLNRNFREFSLINVDFRRRNCPYAECTWAAVIWIYTQ
jgi:hypothetical protein